MSGRKNGTSTPGTLCAKDGSGFRMRMTLLLLAFSSTWVVIHYIRE